jgi:hypothetical protein
MIFSKALECLKLGMSIRRPHWSGYWKKDGDTVKMYCRDGRILDIRETEDTFYTLQNIASEDWEACDMDPDIDIPDYLTMRFGEALRQAKSGKKIARIGWNGKKQYVELATCISYVNAAGETVNAEHDAIGNKAFAFVGTSGVQIGWLASQADMLAEDWYVVEEVNNHECKN